MIDIGQLVDTEFGKGKILFQEGENGYLSHRYCVELEIIPPGLKRLHTKFGGVFLLDKNMQLVKQTPEEKKADNQGELF